MKKIFEKAYERVYKWSIILIFMIIITLICLYNITSTSHLIDWEHTVYVKDYIFPHILTLVITMALMLYLKKSKLYHKMKNKLSEKEEFRKWKCMIIIGIFTLSSIWALSTQFIPGVDEYAVQDYVRGSLEGDFHSFAHMGYMDQYPNQWGFFLFSYFVAIIFGKLNYIVMEIIIAFAISVIFKELSEISGLLGAENVEQICVLLVGIFFVPFLLYSVMIYGNMIGIAFSLSAVKNEILFFKNGNKGNGIKCAICIALGILMKSNMQIYLIAIILSAIANIAKKTKQVLFLIITVCFICYVQSWGVSAGVKRITGYSPNSPITPFAWIAMGLQESDLAPGWWNNYTVNSYNESEGNTQDQKMICKENIKNSINAFRNSPAYCVEFFTKKILSTWANPTFQCFGTVRNGSYIMTPKWVQIMLSYPGQYIITSYLNVLCFLIYFGAFLYMFFLKKDDLNGFILPMIFIGGFTFYLFWETKSRYALMFYVVLIPCAIRGYNYLNVYISTFDKNKRRCCLVELLKFKKMQTITMIITMALFCCLYGNQRYSSLLKQDTNIYKTYVLNAPKLENTEYIGKQ